MRSRSLEKKLLFALLLSIPALAAQFWESKDYSKWTEQECAQLLKKSPWVFPIGFGNVGPALIASNTLNQAEDGTKKMAKPQADPSLISGTSYGERESTQFFEFRVLTAKPVKAAIVQLQVLRNPALKEQARQIVNSKPTDQIIIQFEYRTEPPGSSAVHDIHSYFLHATLSDFRTNTYLASDKVDLLPVKDYLSPNDKRPKPAFVFPRFNEKGEPYFTGQESSITMRSVFEPEIAGKKQKYDIFIKMNPKGMWFQKEFAF
jgi:hypothetical protein